MHDKTTLLYVDDEIINLVLFQANFEDSFNVITAESGKQGLTILDKASNVQIVISDMRMPEMNGIDFIKLAKTKFPKVIFFILMK